MAKYSFTIEGDPFDIYQSVREIRAKNNISIIPVGKKSISFFADSDAKFFEKKRSKKPVEKSNKEIIVSEKIPVKRTIKFSENDTKLCEIKYDPYKDYKFSILDQNIIKYQQTNVKNPNGSTTYRGYLYCATANINKAKKLIGIMLKQDKRVTVNWLV